LGLWDKSAVDLNSLGGIKKMNGDPLVDAKGYDQNFIKWYFDHVLPVYDKMGLDKDQRIRENALLFGGTGGNAMSLVDRQRDLISASYAAYGKAHHIEEGYADAMNTPAGRVTTLSAEWDKTLTHLGEEVLPVTNAGLSTLTGILEGLNAFFGWKSDTKKEMMDMGRNSAQGSLNYWKGKFGFGSADPVPPAPASTTQYLGTTVVQIDKREVGRAATEYQVQGMMQAPSSGTAVDWRLAPQPVN